MDPQQNSQPPVTPAATPIPTESFTPSEIPPAMTPTTTPPSSQQNSNPAPPIPSVEPKKNNMILYVVIILFLVVLVAIGGFLIYNTSNKPVALYSPTPQATVAAVIPTLQATAMPTASAALNGTISGNICYPASGIPAGKIEVKNTVSNELTSFDNASGSATFSVSMPSGQYKVRYIPTNYPTVIGYYTNCTGSEPACQDNTTKRSSIPVTVTSNTDTSGVKLCDYYYAAGMEPDF